MHRFYKWRILVKQRAWRHFEWTVKESRATVVLVVQFMKRCLKLYQNWKSLKNKYIRDLHILSQCVQQEKQI